MKPENSNNSKFLTTPAFVRTSAGRQLLSHLPTLLFYLSILTFIIGFNFTDVMVGNWYQQFMPNLNGRQIVDITFTDSLRGYAITNEVSDTSFILRTTNGGDNWFLNHFDTGIASYYNVQFINQTTGFVSGYIYNGSTFNILKTTNAGSSWFYINSAFDVVATGMYVLNENTIWLVDPGSLTGGVFYTSTGGASWQQQVNLFGGNPDRIYMFNARIGFISRTSSTQLYKTTNSGQNWNAITGVGTGSFNDIYFIDSLTGWKCKTVGGGGWLMGKTTDGGFNWVEQILPFGGNILFQNMRKFDNVSRDTIWGGAGVYRLPNNQLREILYRTTNGGDTWYFQIPDTSIFMGYEHCEFANRLNGWFYDNLPQGIHTTTGGDTTFYLPVKQISSQVPKEFKLYQNYPNPFNPITKIKYETKSKGKSEKTKIEIIVYDVTGKQISELVNEQQSPGTYEIGFDASVYTSGVYFYSLMIDGILIDTKKMILIK